jgi:hypothetical protein
VNPARLIVCDEFDGRQSCLLTVATRKPSPIVLDFRCRSIQLTSLSGNPVLLVVPSNRAEQPADAMRSIAAEQLMKKDASMATTLTFLFFWFALKSEVRSSITAAIRLFACRRTTKKPTARGATGGRLRTVTKATLTLLE